MPWSTQHHIEFACAHWMKYKIQNLTETIYFLLLYSKFNYKIRRQKMIMINTWWIDKSKRSTLDAEVRHGGACLALGCLQKQSLRDPPSIHARTWAGGEAEGSEFKNSIGDIGRDQCRLHETLSQKTKNKAKQNKNQQKNPNKTKNKK